MPPETFVKLRQIIGVTQFKRFLARKEELLQERIEAFKAKKEQEYVMLIRKAGVEYQMLGQTTTQEACEYIEFGEENYVNSFKNCEKRPQIMQQIKENEMNTRDLAEPTSAEDKFSKE